MLEKLDFMMRFWELKARYEAAIRGCCARPRSSASFGAAGAPLSPLERVELLSLLSLMATDDPLPFAGPPPRSEHALEGQITAHGSFVAVEIRMVCASGLVVACLTPLPAGQSTVVRLTDDGTGLEYHLPCVVEWSFAGSPSAMALGVDGAPARMSFVVPEGLPWGSAIGWATEPRATLE
jgi:hypothetical protein